MRKPEVINVSSNSSEFRYLIDTRGCERSKRSEYLEMLEQAKLGEVYSKFNDRFIAIKTNADAREIIEKIIGKNNE